MSDPLALISRIERDLAALRLMLGVPELEPEVEEWLEPCVIAGRLHCSEAHVRRLCERGLKLGIPGIEKRGGRWAATINAVRDARDVRV